jgi:hypothetical protein
VLPQRFLESVPYRPPEAWLLVFTRLSDPISGKE